MFRSMLLLSMAIAMLSMPIAADAFLLGGVPGRPTANPDLKGDLGYSMQHFIYGGGIALQDFLGIPSEEPTGYIGLGFETGSGYYVAMGVQGASRGTEANALEVGLDLKVGYRILGSLEQPVEGPAAALYAGLEAIPVGTQGTQQYPYGAWVFGRLQIAEDHDVRPRVSWHPEGGFAFVLEFGIIRTQ